MSSRQPVQQPPQLPGLPVGLGVLPAYYAPHTTTLIMREKMMSWTGNDYSIKTVEGEPVLRVRGATFSMSNRCEVLDIEGRHLLTVRKELFSFLKNYYAEDPQGSRFLDIDAEWSWGKKKSTISFLNAADEKQTILKMKGDFFDFMTEIKLADSETVIARVDRQAFSGWALLGQGKYFVTIAANVDIALVVAMISSTAAIIDTLSPASTSSSAIQTPSRGNVRASASPSPAQSTGRRSLITRQIYQFALGYPQTPPETSPVSDSNPIDTALGAERVNTEESNMGSFLFQWTHPANEVYVTGTFDDWAKSVKLDSKAGGLHEKLVELPQADEKIYYKFVVDDNWTTDHTAPQETDAHNNTNNVLLPENITKSQSSTGGTASGLMSGVTPLATTSGLAGKVPKEMERTGSSDLPGSFPETPAVESTGFNVGSGSKDTDNSQQTFGVAPIPATAGIGNPVQTKPGEEVPHPSTFTDNTINSAVTTDKESYEKSGAAPQLPNVVTPQKEREARGGMFGLLPTSLKNLIPESSLPMGGSSAEKDPGYTTQSAGPQSTTAGLAGKVPLESDHSRDTTSVVPEMVQESQKEAGFGSEASANKEAVVEKSNMEKELESKVAEAPPTAEGINTEEGGTTDKKGLSEGAIAGMAAGGAGATAAVTAAAGYLAHGSSSTGATSMPTHGLPASIQQSIDGMNKGTAIDPHVPDVVQESITEAHVAPEAAASSEMVQEKSAMEAELLRKIPSEEASGEPAPAIASALSGSAPAPTSESSAVAPNMESEKPSATMDAPLAGPAIVETAPPAPMKSTETPLSQAVPVTTTAGPGLAAPTTAPATTEASKPTIDSRDVSPMTRGPGDSAVPMVTTGIASSLTTASSTATPQKVVASSSTGTTPATSESTDKKKKRRSFFGKIKDRLEHRDKK